MKKYSVIFLLIITILVCIISFPTEALSNPEPNLKEGFLVNDTDSKNPMPKRFRSIESLNISGSAQFEPGQIENLKKAINVLDTYIVDLRQESHGFLITDDAVSFYSPERVLNNGFTSEETLASEKEKFGAIKPGEIENIFNKRGAFKESVTVEKSQIELDLVKNSGMNYILFATRDGHIPTPAVVDSFVSFIAKTPSTTHLHFHCDHGQGRTTMFMSMFQMMKESKAKSLDEILNEQLNAGGIVLTDNTTRSHFLKDFYDYTVENSANNFKVPFSIWSQNNSKSTL